MDIGKRKRSSFESIFQLSIIMVALEGWGILGGQSKLDNPPKDVFPSVFSAETRRISGNQKQQAPICAQQFLG